MTDKFFCITLVFAFNKTISDNEANKMLNRFLLWIRGTDNVSNYMYKSELNKNGNLHYHILVQTTDVIDVNKIRKTWNEIQREAGYLAEFASDPNSVDVKKIL